MYCIYKYICCVNPIGCNNLHDLEHDFWHEGEHQKAPCRARFLARGRAPKSMIFGTRGGTKKHDFVHEEEHQKARFLARGRAPKSTILCTRESAKKHDLEHDFLHEGKHRKARFCARRKTLKTTFFLGATFGG